MTTDLNNFETSEEFALYLFPEMLKGQTERFLFEGYEIRKTKSNQDWLVWKVRNIKGEVFNLSHYTIFCKGRKLKAGDIHLHTWKLTQDKNNPKKIYIEEELEKVIPINVKK